MYTIEHLPLETETFGMRSVKYPLLKGKPVEDVASVVKQFHSQGIEFAHLRLDPSQHELESELRKFKFVEVGELWTFELDIHADSVSAGQPKASLVQELNRGALQELKNLAYESFTQDRFHRDQRLTSDKSSELKARWALNNLLGRAHSNFGFFEDNRLQGFLQVLKHTRHLVIDLVAVSANARGKGVGTALVSRTIDQARSLGLAQVIVGTQGDNITSQKLYSKLGFRVTKKTKSYHWHSQL